MKINNNELYWAKTNPNAIIPTKNNEDAGYDIYPCFDEDYMIIPSHMTSLVPTGIAVAMNDNYYLQVHERGSSGSKGIKISAGVIDSGFRGQIFLAITNSTNRDLVISKLEINELYDVNRLTNINNIIIYPYSKSIAQLIVHIVPKMIDTQISYEELINIPSSRRTGMLGSSNK